MSDATIIREAVQPLTGSAQDYDSLLALIGDARFVFARLISSLPA